MIWLIVALLVVLAAVAAGAIWVFALLVRRIDHFELELEERDRQSFHDIATMFRMQEKIDTLTAERDNAHRCIELLIAEDVKKSKDFETSLELVLNGR